MTKESLSMSYPHCREERGLYEYEICDGVKAASNLANL